MDEELETQGLIFRTYVKSGGRKSLAGQRHDTWSQEVESPWLGSGMILMGTLAHSGFLPAILRFCLVVTRWMLNFQTWLHARQKEKDRLFFLLRLRSFYPRREAVPGGLLHNISLVRILTLGQHQLHGTLGSWVSSFPSSGKSLTLEIPQVWIPVQAVWPWPRRSFVPQFTHL